jgi:uncharacterized membrane protein YdbT with pleckstrin-like domain
MFDPRIERHLIADQGEVVIDEVRKHWAAVLLPRIELFFGIVILVLCLAVPSQAWWVPVVVGGLLVAHASWRILERKMDRFVITNMRVFRVHGILSQSIATMPLTRILDISVHKPIIGRMLGYGHFVFESAAQEQGLREIRYVGNPDQRGITIQRVIQQSGLRGFNAQQPFARQGVPAESRSEPMADTARWDDGPWLQSIPPKPPLPVRPAHPPFDPDRADTAPIDLTY